MSKHLDPEEALSGPLYGVAALLILIPAAEFVFTVPPLNFSNEQWRFGAVSLLSGHAIMPILGLSLALIVSTVTKQPRVQRALIAGCLTTALGLAGMSAGFMLDVRDLRQSVPGDQRAAFNSAWKRTIITLLLSTAVLAYLGWRARRMIPATSRHRSPTSVHVITK